MHDVRLAAATLALLAATAPGKAAVTAHPIGKPNFIPISVWWQTANGTGHSGPYPTIAAATAAAGMNIMLGQGANWPETFGADYGEFEAIAQNNLYLIGGVEVPWNENTSATSVASILALAHSIAADNNLLGYNAGDEPQCQPGSGQYGMWQVPQVIAGIKSYDPTRLVLMNGTDWEIQPEWQTHPPQCLQWDIAALQAPGVASFDYYPLTSPYIATQLGVGGTDHKSVPNDSLWVQGLSVQAMAHFAAQGQPLWAFIEAGGDNFGLSEANNNTTIQTTAGSSLIVSPDGRFSTSWIGLSVAGANIPANTTIVSVIDGQHAEISNAATGGSSGQSVAIAGGTAGDCVGSVNLCVVNGNEYRPTPAQVFAEVWMSLINGATGIEYFCHDHTSYSFCLGDSAAGGAAATIAFNNLVKIDQSVRTEAKVLNARTLGRCSMDTLNYTTGQVSTGQSCSGGSLGMVSSNPAVPGAAVLKSYGNALYLIAQSSRRGNGGATFTFSLPGATAGKQAIVAFDSNTIYDPAHDTRGKKIAIGAGGAFADTIGTFDDYETKIYIVQ